MAAAYGGAVIRLCRLIHCSMMLLLLPLLLLLVVPQGFQGLLPPQAGPLVRGQGGQGDWQPVLQLPRYVSLCVHGCQPWAQQRLGGQLAGLHSSLAMNEMHGAR